jgi:hypothetical protein
MSNYPPGVTGFEPQIAGSHEMDEQLLVDACEFEGADGNVCTFEGGAVDGIVYDHEQFEWVCPECGTTNAMDVTERYSEPERDYEPGDWDYS